MLQNNWTSLNDTDVSDVFTIGSGPPWLEVAILIAILLKWMSLCLTVGQSSILTPPRIYSNFQHVQDMCACAQGLIMIGESSSAQVDEELLRKFSRPSRGFEPRSSSLF